MAHDAYIYSALSWEERITALQAFNNCK